jgi:cytochrome b pre-mRNA-processing protein 3
MPLRRLLDRRRRERIAHDLYSGIILQSRHPDFYVTQEVPDTLDGRFDLIVLHAYLVMRRLKRIDGPQGEEARIVSQALFDLMFDDMDQNLREMGVGDMSVGKRIKQMARAFYGRVAAYEDALADARDDALASALARNLYGTLDSPPSGASLAIMATYLRRQDLALSEQKDDAILDGQVRFPALETAHVP